MACGCGGGDKRNFTDVFGNPLPLKDGKKGQPSFEAQQLVEPPAPHLEAYEPPDLSEIETLPVRDVSPAVSKTNGLFVIEEPIAGIALSGFCPPGAICLLAPLSRRGELLAIGNLHYASRDLATLLTAGPTKPRSGASASSGLPAGAIILRPGEALSFGRKVRGLAGIFANPWTNVLNNGSAAPGVYPTPYGATDATLVGNSAQSFVSDVGAWGPGFRPYLRLFDDPGAVPHRVAYTKVPHVVGFVPPNPIGGGTEAAITAQSHDLFIAGNPFTHGGVAWALIPPGTKHVTVSMAATYSSSVPKIAGTAAPVLYSLNGVGVIPGGGGGTTSDLRLWWMTSDGMLHFNPGDSWTTPGRGAISATHSVEVYDVPNNAIAVFPWMSSPSIVTTNSNGSLPWITFAFTED